MARQLLYFGLMHESSQHLPAEPPAPESRAKPYDRTLTEPERLAQQRQTIVATALQLFSERPAGEVGINDIAAAARMAKRTIYMHFASFDDVCSAAFEHVWNGFMSDFWTVAQAEEPLIEAVHLIAERAAKEPLNLKFATDGIGALSAKVVALRDNMAMTVASAWASAHNMDCERGVTPHPMTTEEAFGWLAMLRGMVSVAAEKPTPEERRAFVLRFLTIYWRAHPYTPLRSKLP